MYFLSGEGQIYRGTSMKGDRDKVEGRNILAKRGGDRQKQKDGGGII
jgi:hypothetical protein